MIAPIEQSNRLAPYHAYWRFEGRSAFAGPGPGCTVRTLGSAAQCFARQLSVKNQIGFASLFLFWRLEMDCFAGNGYRRQKASMAPAANKTSSPDFVLLAQFQPRWQ